MCSFFPLSLPQRRQWLDRWWLLTNDPGGQYFIQALRATLAAITASSIMVLLYKFIAPGQEIPNATIVFTLVMTLLSTAIIFNNLHKQQKKTIIWLIIPLVTLSQLAALVSPFPLLTNLLFLGCIFAMFYVRRFGLSIAVLGFIGLYCYYLPINNQVTIQQEPLLLLAALVVIACAYTFRFLLFPSHPERILLHSIATFQQRALTVAKLLRQLPVETAPRKRQQQAIRRRLAQLQECAHQIKTQYISPDLKDEIGQTWLDQIEVALADTQKALETLHLSLTSVMALEVPLSGEQRAQLTRLLQTFLSLLTHPEGSSIKNELASLLTSATTTPDSSDQETMQTYPFLLLRITDSTDQCLAASEQLQQAYQQIAAQQAVRPIAKPEPPTAQPEQATEPQMPTVPQQLRPTTKLAWRALLACGICLLIGPIISPDHPYWAAITACTVTAISFGATKKKALAQTIATLCGACLSFVLVALFSALPHGNMFFIALLLLSLFMTMYRLTALPPHIAFWVIMSIALANGLSGGLTATIAVIINRSIDTLLGCSVAIVIMLTVFSAQKDKDMRID